MNDRDYRYTTYSTEPSVVGTPTSPSGRQSYRASNNTGEGMEYTFPSTVSTLRVGFYHQSTYESSGDNGHYGPCLRDQFGNTHICLTRESGHRLSLRRGPTGAGTVLGTSSVNSFLLDTWHWIEIWATLADSGGRAVMQIDGTTEIDFTGDTRYTGSETTFGRFQIRRTGSYTYYSDIILADDSNFSGPSTVWEMRANANGNTSGFNGSDGNQTDNYLLVDESSPDDDSTYVYSSAAASAGVYDTYGMENLPSGSWTIESVQTNIVAKASDAGVKSYRPVVRINGTDYTGTDEQLTAQYHTWTENFATSPDTAAAWTESEVDAIEVGPESR